MIISENRYTLFASPTFGSGSCSSRLLKKALAGEF
jgi:hypothetical protein